MRLLWSLSFFSFQRSFFFCPGNFLLLKNGTNGKSLDKRGDWVFIFTNIHVYVVLLVKKDSKVDVLMEKLVHSLF